MLVLLAMIAEGAFPGSVSIESLMQRVRVLARRSAALRTELGEALDGESKLRDLLEKNPIDAWVGGKGTRGESFFSYDGGRFATTVTVPEPLREAAAELVRELADWRLTVYLRRVGSVGGAPRIVCKVSHTNGRPILFLPSADRTAGIPEGWVDVTADGERYHAKFVKIAVNVLTKDGDYRNVLPELLQKWFGERAGQPGTTHWVVFERAGESGYVLSPVSRS